MLSRRYQESFTAVSRAYRIVAQAALTFRPLGTLANWLARLQLAEQLSTDLAVVVIGAGVLTACVVFILGTLYCSGKSHICCCLQLLHLLQWYNTRTSDSLAAL